MIRINLLPVQEVQNKLDLFNQIRVGLIALVVVIALMAFMSISIKGRINAQKVELDSLQAELNRLNRKGVEKKFREFKKLSKELGAKIDVIWEKKSEQAGPVHLLDGVSSSLPERVWLNSLEETQRGIQLKGYAYSNVDVAQFMSNLEKSEYFSDVELLQSGQANVADHKVMVFSMNMKYHPPKGWLLDGSGKKK